MHVAEIGEVAHQRLEIPALTIDREGGFDACERLTVAPLMPAKEPEAPERVPLRHGVAQLTPQPERPIECGLGLIESPEQRVEVALAQVRLAEARRIARRSEERHQLIDDPLLPAPQAQCLAKPLLPEQDVDQHLARSGPLGEAEEPALGPLQDLQGLGELAQRVGPLGGDPRVQYGLGPLFGAAEMLHEAADLLVEAGAVQALDGLAHPAVQLLSLVL